MCNSYLGTECANGVKLSIDILEAHPSSSTVDPTTTASNTMNPTGTGSAGTVTGSAGTVTGSAGTVTGSTTSRTSGIYSYCSTITVRHEIYVTKNFLKSCNSKIS